MKTPPAHHVELHKLAHVLDLDASRLAFLAHIPHDQLAELRLHVSHVLYERQEPRFRRMAAAAKVIPNALLAKAAQFAIGPRISAWAASVLPAEQAVKLAGSLEIAFLTQVSRWLDTHRSVAILAALPDSLTIAVGRNLVDLGEWIPLGRYLVVVSPTVTLGVMAHADDDQLRHMATYLEIPSPPTPQQRVALRSVFDRLSDDRRALVLAAAQATIAALIDDTDAA